MKKYFLFVCFFVCFNIVTVFAFSPVPGNTLQDFTLSMPSQGAGAGNIDSYLMVKNPNSFLISEIGAEVILIQIFSMYCPYCQAEAVPVNKMFGKLRASAHKDKLKMIAVGAGNSEFEVDIFRKKYKIDLPLFADEDFSVHKILGDVGTPFYMLIRPDKKGALKILYTHKGVIKDHDKFLEKIITIAGRKK